MRYFCLALSFALAGCDWPDSVLDIVNSVDIPKDQIAKDDCQGEVALDDNLRVTDASVSACALTATYAKLRAGATKDRERYDRLTIALTALRELPLPQDVGLCGDPARKRYGASGAWCSEFSRWVFLKAGLPNGCVDDSILGVCLVSLKSMSVTSQLKDYFDMHHRWVPSERFIMGSRTPLSDFVLSSDGKAKASLNAGDYMALVGSSGPIGHSAVVVAVSADERSVWTVEGNNGDCVRFVRRDLELADGTIFDKINGIGTFQNYAW